MWAIQVRDRCRALFGVYHTDITLSVLRLSACSNMQGPTCPYDRLAAGAQCVVSGFWDVHGRTEEAREFEVVRLPSDNDRAAWHAFCFGRQPSVHHINRAPEAGAVARVGADVRMLVNRDPDDSQGQQPSLPVLLSMDSVRPSHSQKHISSTEIILALFR